MGTWYRAVDPLFLATAISTTHTSTRASRFSPATPHTPGFQVLYLAENPLVAQYEIGALFGSLTSPHGVIPNPSVGVVILPISVNVSDIADLTAPAQGHIVDTNAQELTGDWRSYPNRKSTPPSPHAGKAPTQQFGDELFRLAVYKGFISFSAKLPDYKILAIFVQLLIRGTDKIDYTYHDLHGVLQTVSVP